MRRVTRSISASPAGKRTGQAATGDLTVLKRIVAEMPAVGEVIPWATFQNTRIGGGQDEQFEDRGMSGDDFAAEDSEAPTDFAENLAAASGDEDIVDDIPVSPRKPWSVSVVITPRMSDVEGIAPRRTERTPTMSSSRVPSPDRVTHPRPIGTTPARPTSPRRSPVRIVTTPRHAKATPSRIETVEDAGPALESPISAERAAMPLTPRVSVSATPTPRQVVDEDHATTSTSPITGETVNAASNQIRISEILDMLSTSARQKVFAGGFDIEAVLAEMPAEELDNMKNMTKTALLQRLMQIKKDVRGSTIAMGSRARTTPVLGSAARSAAARSPTRSSAVRSPTRSAVRSPTRSSAARSPARSAVRSQTRSATRSSAAPSAASSEFLDREEEAHAVDEDLPPPEISTPVLETPKRAATPKRAPLTRKRAGGRGEIAMMETEFTNLSPSVVSALDVGARDTLPNPIAHGFNIDVERVIPTVNPSPERSSAQRRRAATMAAPHRPSPVRSSSPGQRVSRDVAERDALVDVAACLAATSPERPVVGGIGADDEGELLTNVDVEKLRNTLAPKPRRGRGAKAWRDQGGAADAEDGRYTADELRAIAGAFGLDSRGGREAIATRIAKHLNLE